MNLERGSGILLHPTSLPGPYGIGDLGPQAHRWVDFLAAAGCSHWHILPLGPTENCGSPYQCLSAFAGNPWLISPDALVGDGLLDAADLEPLRLKVDKVDFAAVARTKSRLFDLAHARFTAGRGASLTQEYASFKEENAAWLADYALFAVLKEAYGGRRAESWPEPLRRRSQKDLANARDSLAGRIETATFAQFLFFRQWRALSDHARERGVRIIGDVPIFVADESAEVWARPELFWLDERGEPTVVAGVPPDYFSETGQLWGNPLYRWEAHRDTGFGWWIDRLKRALGLYDLVRLDHFRGFAAYWEIPAGQKTAAGGRWMPGPGADLLEAMSRALGDLRIIAEDLGAITPDVVALRDRFRLPGMKVLQFAFTGPDNPFLPHHHVPQAVVYTGTHDNDTTRGWFAAAPAAEREFCLNYLGLEKKDIPWGVIRAAWSSVCSLAIAPMQDFLELDSSARMNFPGTSSGNWAWRMAEGAASDALAAKIRELNTLYQRA